MNAISEYLQAQKATTSTSAANPSIATDAIVVTTSVDAVVDIVIQLVVSQPIYQSGPSRNAASYPWGLPPNFTPQVANGNSLVPYQSFVVHPANGNSVARPWGMTIHSPQMVNIDNREVNPEQVLQSSTLVIF